MELYFNGLIIGYVLGLCIGYKWGEGNVEDKVKSSLACIDSGAPPKVCIETAFGIKEK